MQINLMKNRITYWSMEISRKVLWHIFVGCCSAGILPASCPHPVVLVHDHNPFQQPHSGDILACSLVRHSVCLQARQLIRLVLNCGFHSMKQLQSISTPMDSEVHLPVPIYSGQRDISVRAMCLAQEYNQYSTMTPHRSLEMGPLDLGSNILTILKATVCSTPALNSPPNPLILL